MKKYLSKKYLALFQAVLIFVWLADCPLWLKRILTTAYSFYVVWQDWRGCSTTGGTPSDGLQLCTCLREYLHCW